MPASSRSIFPLLALDRSKVKWSEFLYELTPVEDHGDIAMKREDYFAPCGYGGINGSKLRNLIVLFEQYVVGHYGGIMGAGSVRSPFHAMAAVTAKHYGLASLSVIGATKPETCIQHSSVAVAAAAGARFEFARVAYNPALQSKLRGMSRLRAYREYYPVGYAISLDHEQYAPEAVKAFHESGAHQTSNIPSHIKKLIVPAGSCVTATSVLYGLAYRNLPELTQVHLVGVGHNRMEWLRARLSALGVELNPRGIDEGYVLHNLEGDIPPYTVYYHDLVGTGWTEYQKRVKSVWHGVVGHPNYEAKVFTWLKTMRPDLIQPTTCVWVVGSEPTLTPTMKRLLESEP